jgi:hypothetical protein
MDEAARSGIQARSVGTSTAEPGPGGRRAHAGGRSRIAARAVVRVPSGSGWRSRWSGVSTTVAILVPICALVLLGFPYLLALAQGNDDRFFMNVGHGVLAHGYPYETIHTPSGNAFFDHTPLFGYLLAIPAVVDDLLGYRAGLATGRLLTAVLGVATVVVTYLVCRDARGAVSGVVAAVLVATNQYFVRLSWVMHMEVPMAFFLVLALYCILHQRMLLAGLAIATAVMLKEHAFGFWIVAAAYVLLVHGWRPAMRVALPSVVAFAAWAAAAFAIDQHQARFVLHRWLDSAGGESDVNPRFAVTWAQWAVTVSRDIIGLPLGGISLVTAGLALVRRAPVPAITAVPIVYCVLATVTSFLIHLKEERWLTAVIPMAAISVGLLVDWGALARWVSVHGAHSGAASRPVTDAGAETPREPA